MRKILTFLATCHWILFLSASATIINVPDDYHAIQQAIDASQDGDTVLVQPRIYIENINFNGHNIVLGSLFLTTGDTSYISQTIIDGDSSGSVVTFESGEKKTAILTGCTIRNGNSFRGGGIFCRESGPTISNNLITSNWAFRQNAYTGGAGICCENAWPIIARNVITANETWWFPGGTGGGIRCYGDSTPVITDNYIAGNQAVEGAGISCSGNAVIIGNTIRGNVAIAFEWMGSGGGMGLFNSNAIVAGNLISGNTAGDGGGISCYMSDVSILNNVINGNRVLFYNSEVGKGGGIYCYESCPTIMNNTITENTADISGAGICCDMVSNAKITNTILWGDSARFSPEIDFDDSSSPTFVYSDIEGGWGGQSNIDTDPLFRDAENGNYHLMSTECGNRFDSPCIDAGDPATFDNPRGCDWGLGELRSDMGAYGGQAIRTDTDEEKEARVPYNYRLFQNYPNPFNAATVIRYALPEAGHVKIEIFDILGRRVQTLVDEYRQAGYHRIIWNTEGNSSGIYLYRIEAGNNVETRKMLVLK